MRIISFLQGQIPSWVWRIYKTTRWDFLLLWNFSLTAFPLWFSETAKSCFSTRSTLSVYPLQLVFRNFFFLLQFSLKADDSLKATKPRSSLQLLHACKRSQKASKRQRNQANLTSCSGYGVKHFWNLFEICGHVKMFQIFKLILKLFRRREAPVEKNNETLYIFYSGYNLKRKQNHSKPPNIFFVTINPN